MDSPALRPSDSPAWAFTGALLILALAAWSWQIAAVRDMAAMAAMDDMGEMAMPATDWTSGQALAAAAMWLIMMQAMMLPAALPAFLLYRRCLARDPGRSAKLAGFVGAYALVWSGFALGMTGLQALGEGLGVLDWRLTLPPAWAGAALVLAGIYQASRLKARCQRQCQSPLAYLARHGQRGGFRLGLGHGLYCLGCCWALMLLLLAAGAMNILAMAVLSLWVLVEKCLPLGRRWQLVSATVLLAGGAWLLTTSAGA